ncbi:MAG TPA: TIGR02266 family protein [Myxococcota bacterium]|nr:TIGR02266 family protein [Myxococcota bacterium]
MAKARIEISEADDERSDGGEKRRSERTPLVVRVDYTTVDSFFSEFTANINEGGLFIEAESPPPSGTAVLLQFKLPGEEEPIRVHGRVVWTSARQGSEGPGMGIEFEDLDRVARARIDQVVRNLRRDSSPGRLVRVRRDAS